MTTLEKLVNTALLGTERQPFAMPELPEDFGPSKLLKRLPPSEEGSLLRGAAICSAYRQAGLLSQSFKGTLPEPASANEKPEVSAGAAAVLDRMLKGQYPEYLPLWLTLAANAGQVAPGQYLPLLLDVAAGSKRQRPLIATVMGTRGAWLADQNPKWKAMVAGTAGWNSETKEQRLDYFQDLRSRNPAAARALLQESWKELGGPERAELVQAFKANATMDDHDFLESLLDEKRADIRQAAADVLLALPESHLVCRMVERSRSIIRAEKSLLKGKRLTVDLPPECDASMQRDCMNVKSTKGRWLTHTIESIPVHQWEQELDLTPEKFVSAALKTDFAKEILQGLTRSAARMGSASWAAAITMNPDVMKQLDLQEISALLLSLAPESREEIVERLISSKADVAYTVLSFTPAPWGKTLSQTAFEQILKPMASLQNLDYNARIMLTQIADGLSGSLSPQVFSAATVASESSSAARQWNDFLSRYTFRTQIEKEFPCDKTS